MRFSSPSAEPCSPAAEGTQDAAAAAPSLAITEENAQSTAQAAFEMSIIRASSNLLGIASSGQASSSSITLKDIALDAVKRMRAHADSGTSSRLTAQVTSTETVNCFYGGTYTETEVDQDGDPETAQGGDKITFTFNNCKYLDNITFNGTQTITLTSLTEDSETRLKASLKIANDLNIRGGSNQVSLKGIIQLSMDKTRACQDCPLTTALIGLKSDVVPPPALAARAAATPLQAAP
ncbi:MAG: hypothetical protein P3W87_002960 [Gammaproteobacteria bacterium]|nr:hypothetical protein [Gammaproteobacteria bacterium]